MKFHGGLRGGHSAALATEREEADVLEMRTILLGVIGHLTFQA